MSNSKKEEFGGDENTIEDGNQTTEDFLEGESSDDGSGGDDLSSGSGGGRRGGGCGLTERLREIFRNGGDGDLLLQQRDREDNVLQWLQALDLQVIGACRVDERLKPLLKMNVSCGVAEDNLLAHLSQHFEVPEVGMLARCLCVPLVSVRVGRIVKEGKLLCPTNTRGNLNLTLLLSSDFRISFVGDDGYIEILFTCNSDSESSVVIEEIPADKSGRSFFIELSGGQVSYFWCSEQSKVVGLELLTKMKDLLRNKPCLAQLTGISKSRLDCFATHLRAYLGSTMSNRLIDTAIVTQPECDSNFQASSSSIKHSRPRHISGQAVRPHSQYQCSLSPRSNSFKDGAPRVLSSTRSGVVREKFKRRGDSHCSFSAVDSLLVVSSSTTEASATRQIEKGKLPEISQCLPSSPVNYLDSLGESACPPSSSIVSLPLPLPQTPTGGTSLFSPYYCWCPPCTSTVQYTVTPHQLPHSSPESLTLPPLASLISGARSFGSLAPPSPPFSLADVSSSLEFPAFLPDSVFRVPLPVSSFITMPNSQQIPTFTPLMCDPIVHIPVIDVCSSGQGYLVSAGPTISTTIIPPLQSNFVNPLIPKTESLVEKGARETLRLLLSSTQTNPQLMEVFPSDLTSSEEIQSCNLSVGNRGFYSGTRDVEVIANSIAVMGLVSLPHIGGGDITTRCSSYDSNLEKHSEVPGEDSEGSLCLDDEKKDSMLFNNDFRERLDAA